ncbi:MAG: UTP--glucose-1-phosphate uridylyltransferase [Elusimicrobia bacterium]|nr:UTP--glucose-1-phosphate uridylyltransferase [Elusimicrobiota bacterium]
MIDDLLRKYNYPADEIERLILEYKKGLITPENNIIKEKIELPEEEDFISLPPAGTGEYSRLCALGKESIEKGELGVIILNGGMATRFGGVVKGIVEVFDGKSFLELKIASGLKVSGRLRFFIMNSFSTEEKTVEHLEKNRHFGIAGRIRVFSQYIAPRIKADGEYFTGKDPLQSYYGPGHGDLPYAFRSSGLLKEFLGSGGKYVFYSNVDNLGATVDPSILGFHIDSGKELTSEVALKVPGDEGGAPAVVGGRLQMVEGFSFPRGFASSSISVFNCSTYWATARSLDREFDLPWYIVKKKIEGEEVIQFERLAGDLTRYLSTNFLKVPRDKRFHPVKRPEDLEKDRGALKKLLGY